jgi:hypothetical protein
MYSELIPELRTLIEWNLRIIWDQPWCPLQRGCFLLGGFSELLHCQVSFMRGCPFLGGRFHRTHHLLYTHYLNIIIQEWEVTLLEQILK